MHGGSVEGAVHHEQDLPDSNGLLEVAGLVYGNAESDERAGDRAAAITANRQVLPQVTCPEDGSKSGYYCRLNTAEPVHQVGKAVAVLGGVFEIF